MGWDNATTTDDVINTSDAPGDTLSESLELLDKLHFAVYSVDTIPIGTSSSSPNGRHTSRYSNTRRYTG